MKTVRIALALFSSVVLTLGGCASTSGPSNPAGDTPDAKLPPAPINLTATGLVNSVALQWSYAAMTPTNDAVTGVFVDRTIAGPPYASGWVRYATIKGTNITSYLDLTPVPGTNNGYRIFSANGKDTP
jgi:hypothetical protein